MAVSVPLSGPPARPLRKDDRCPTAFSASVAGAGKDDIWPAAQLSHLAVVKLVAGGWVHNYMLARSWPNEGSPEVPLSQRPTPRQKTAHRDHVRFSCSADGRRSACCRNNHPIASCFAICALEIVPLPPVGRGPGRGRAARAPCPTSRRWPALHTVGSSAGRLSEEPAGCRRRVAVEPMPMWIEVGMRAARLMRDKQLGTVLAHRRRSEGDLARSRVFLRDYQLASGGCMATSATVRPRRS